MAERGLGTEGDRWGMEEEIDYGEEPLDEPEASEAEQPAIDDKVAPAAKSAAGRGVLAGGKIDLSGKGDGRSRHGERDEGRGRHREEGDRREVGDRDRHRRDDGRRERRDPENAVRDGGRREGERWEPERREDERQEMGDRDREKKHRHRHKSRKDEHSHADNFDAGPSADPRPEDDVPHRSSKDSRRSRRARDDAPADFDHPEDPPVVSPRDRFPTPENKRKDAVGDERKSRKGGDVNGHRGGRWDRREDIVGDKERVKEADDENRRGYDREERGESERRSERGVSDRREDRGADDRRAFDRDSERREGRGFDDRRAFDRDDNRRGRFDQRVGFDGGREKGPRSPPHEKRFRRSPSWGGRDDFRREGDKRWERDDKRWEGDKRWEDDRRDERRFKGGDDSKGGRERRFGRHDDDWESHPPDRRWAEKDEERGGGNRREDEARGFRESREGFEDFRGRGPFRQEEEPPRRAPSPVPGRTPPRRDIPETSRERNLDRKRSPGLRTRSPTPPSKRRGLENPVGERARDSERSRDLDPSPRSQRAHHDNGGAVDEPPPPPRRGKRRSISPPARARSVRGESVQRESKTVDDFEFERSERRQAARSRNESEERESRAPPRSPIDDRRSTPRFEGRSPIRPPPLFPEGGLPPHEKGRGRGGFGMDMGPRWRGAEFPRGRGGYAPPPFSSAFAPLQFGGPPRPFPARVPGPEFGPGPLPFGPRGQFPEGGFGRGWRGPPRHEMDGPVAMVPRGPWERNEPWGGDQPRRDFAPPFEMGGERRDQESEGRPVRKAPVSGSGGERKEGEDKARPAPPKMQKREPRKGNTAIAAVKGLAGGLHVSRILAGAELFEEYKTLLPLSVAMRKGAAISEKITASPEEETEAAGAEERLQALGLADKLPRGTFEAALKLLTKSDAQSYVQQSAVGQFELPAAVQDLKLGPKPVFVTLNSKDGAEVSPNHDLEAGNSSQVDAKPGLKAVGCLEEGSMGEVGGGLPVFAEEEGRNRAENFGNGKLENDKTLGDKFAGEDEENVDYGNLDVGMEDEVDYGMDQDEGYGGLGGLGTSGFAVGQSFDDVESDPELDMALGRRMAELIGAESRAKAAANASGQSTGTVGKDGGVQQVHTKSKPPTKNENGEGDAQKQEGAGGMGSESGIQSERSAGETLTRHTL